MTTLVLVAHPDDETLGAGGWIRKMAETGEDVDLRVICGGAPGRQRLDHLQQATRNLGITSYVRVYNFPDQTLATTKVSEITWKIGDDDFDTSSYDRIITHGPYDLNDDHRKVFEAAMVLTRPPWKGELYTMYIPSSTEWAFGQFGDFRPNTFVELEEQHLKAKLEAFNQYDTERQDWPLPRNTSGLTEHAAYWGKVIGTQFAEPFQLVKRVL